MVSEWDHDYDVHLHVTSVEYTQLEDKQAQKERKTSREGGGRVKDC